MGFGCLWEDRPLPWDRHPVRLCRKHPGQGRGQEIHPYFHNWPVKMPSMYQAL